MNALLPKFTQKQQSQCLLAGAGFKALGISIQ
jgi:hypothetical protein